MHFDSKQAAAQKKTPKAAESPRAKEGAPTKGRRADPAKTSAQENAPTRGPSSRAKAPAPQAESETAPASTAAPQQQQTATRPQKKQASSIVELHLLNFHDTLEDPEPEARSTDGERFQIVASPRNMLSLDTEKMTFALSRKDLFEEGGKATSSIGANETSTGLSKEDRNAYKILRSQGRKSKAVELDGKRAARSMLLNEVRKEGGEKWKAPKFGLKYKCAFESCKETLYIVGLFSPQAEDRKTVVVKDAGGKPLPCTEVRGKDLAKLADHLPEAKGHERRVWKADLTYEGSGIAMYAKPSTYLVSASGGDGREKQAKVDVYPATFNTLEFGISGKQESTNSSSTGLLSTLVDKLQALSKNPLSPASFTVSCGGGFEFTWGWVEEDDKEEADTALASYVITGSAFMKPIIQVEGELTLSAMQAYAAMPTCVSDHIGDLRLTFKIGGGLAFVGEFAHHLVPGQMERPFGGLKLTGKVEAGIELSAHLGSKYVIQVEAKGEVATGVTVEGQFTFSHKAVRMKTKGRTDKMVLSVTVTTYFLRHSPNEHVGNKWTVLPEFEWWSSNSVLRDFTADKH